MKKHIPNTITCCNLISGCIATYWAFQSNYQLALLFIVIGAVFDFFDGMSARLLGVSSPIGKELDSLADDITFGFAPSAMVFSWINAQCTMHNSQLFAASSVGATDYALGIVNYALPYLAFIIAAFSALRLAKFNLDERQALGFIDALFWGSLIVGLDQNGYTFEGLEWVILAGMFISCYLLIAEIPMFALKFKHWGWKGNEVKYCFILSCVPILLLLNISGLAVIIAWYVLLSVITNRK